MTILKNLFTKGTYPRRFCAVKIPQYIVIDSIAIANKEFIEGQIFLVISCINIIWPKGKYSMNKASYIAVFWSI